MCKERKKLKNVDSGKPPTERVFINENLTKRNKHLLYFVNDKRKKFGWKYIWTNNGRIHLRQNNDSKAIAIRSEKDLEQIRKPAINTENLSGTSHLLDPVVLNLFLTSYQFYVNPANQQNLLLKNLIIYLH